MTYNAKMAIKAAKHRYQWGREAAKRFCERRNIPLALYYLACRLEAAERV
jgi:hypothetical protein